MRKVESICIFGDSISWGAWDLEKGGWANRLWLHIGKRDENYVELYNLSISGGSSETILQRFEKEATIRKADALIFQTGGNDASCPHSTEDHLISPDKFEENIQNIIDKAKKITENIIFIGLTNCDESKTRPVPWIDLDYRNDHRSKYDQIIESVCTKNGIPFLPQKPLSDEDFDDGLHPNSAGHEKIFEQVKDFITKNNWI